VRVEVITIAPFDALALVDSARAVGLNADVVTDGTIAVGDAVDVTAAGA